MKKFNSGQVDVIAAPAYAYKPLEISKGLANGALFNFPVVNITGFNYSSKNFLQILVPNLDNGSSTNCQNNFGNGTAFRIRHECVLSHEEIKYAIKNVARRTNEC